MLGKSKGTASIALLAGLSVIAAAGCSGSSKSPSGAGGSSSSPSQSAQGTPKKGGTLKMIGNSDVDHLDTASAYYTVSYTVLRGYSRQLVTYPNSSDITKANTVVPDMAESIPTPTDGGKTYTFKIKQGVKWDAPTGPRQVTASDFVYGFKRLCNPAEGTGALGYFTGTIQGMADYCTGFAKVDGNNAAAMEQYIQGHNVAGIQAPDPSTVVFHLIEPASDFLNILALPFSSPAPKEYGQYIPDSPQFRQHVISDGPYKFQTYTPDKGMTLVRNPAWDPKTDDVRHAYVDQIQVTLGLDEGPIQQQLEAGTADMEWDTTVPSSEVASLIAKKDPNLALEDLGSINYVVFNLLSPSNNKALANVKVRQALEYAVNKMHVVTAQGGSQLFQPATQILTKPILGYKQFNPYPTPNSEGDPAKAKKMLADAGFPNGLHLKLMHRTTIYHPRVAQVLQADFAKAGVTIDLIPKKPSEFYGKILEDPNSAKGGQWDLATPGWNPDWQGNAARSFFVPLLDGRGFGPGTTNYGDYNNPKVNDLIDKALTASSQSQAADYWHQADVTAMADAPWIPLTIGKFPYYHSTTVKGWVFFPFANNGDITNVWK